MRTLLTLTLVGIAVAPSLPAPTFGKRTPVSLAAKSQSVAPSALAAAYSRAVTRICAGALLFDHTHQMGTRADALSVARDIRASTASRLARVATLPTPPGLTHLISRWTASQRQLAALYARTWVRIYDTIAAARTPSQLASLAQRLERLVHLPDRLRTVAARLDLRLRVPDCTGGGAGPPPNAASP